MELNLRLRLQIFKVLSQYLFKKNGNKTNNFFTGRFSLLGRLCPGVRVQRGNNHCTPLFTNPLFSCWTWVFCIGSCEPVREDRTPRPMERTNKMDQLIIIATERTARSKTSIWNYLMLCLLLTWFQVSGDCVRRQMKEWRQYSCYQVILNETT